MSEATLHSLYAVRDTSLAPGHVVLSTEAAQRMAETSTWHFVAGLRTTKHGRERYTNEPTGVTGERLHGVGPDGLPRVGVTFEPGEVIVGRESPVATNAASGAIGSLLDGLFGASEPNWRDTSVRFEAGTRGTVTAVEWVARPGRTPTEVRIDMERYEPLGPGDVLMLDDGSFVIVCDVRADLDGDIALPDHEGDIHVRVWVLGRLALSGRAIGPYDPFSEQPTDVGGLPWRGVSTRQLNVLRRASCEWTVHELVTVVSDSMDVRSALFEGICTGKPRQFHTIPESARALQAHLIAFGMWTDVTKADSVFIEWAERDEFLAHSGGPVRTGLYERTGADPASPPGGLFCSQLFGSTRRERRERFAHIQLPHAISHPLNPERTLDFIPVLPPALRPVAPETQWLPHDLTRTYARILRHVNAVEARPDTELTELVARLFEELGTRLTCLLDMQICAKAVDYAGRALTMCDPTVDDDAVGVPRDLLEEMMRPWTYHELQARGHAASIRAARDLTFARTPEALVALIEACLGRTMLVFSETAGLALDCQPIDGTAIRLSPATWAELELSAGASVHLHAPVSAEATAELEAKLRPGMARTATTSSQSNERWLVRAIHANDPMPVLLEAANAGAHDLGWHPDVRMLLGRPPRSG